MSETKLPLTAPTDEEINERCKQYGEREIFAGAVSRNAAQQYASYDFAQGAYWMRKRLNGAVQANSEATINPHVTKGQFVEALREYEENRYQGPGNAMLAALTKLGIDVVE